jgi:DNA-binding IclR family transcriptional regulator
MTTSASPARSPAVRKAARVLAELATAPEGRSVADIARRVDAPKSTLADIATVLVDTGMAARGPDGVLRLGPAVARLARGLVGGTPLLDLFPGVIREQGPLEPTVVLAVLVDLDTAYVAVERGTTPLPLTLAVGLRLPAWSTATGRALLSAHPSEVVASMHRERVPQSPRGGPFRLDDLLAAVAAARRTGHASNTEVGEMQLAGTAALVHGPDGPVAAVGAVSPLAEAGRREERDVTLVRHVADRLTAALVPTDSSVATAPESPHSI